VIKNAPSVASPLAIAEAVIMEQSISKTISLYLSHLTKTDKDLVAAKIPEI
jgi:hypothetical protein